MGTLFEEATKQPHLLNAWRKIRENGYASSMEETRNAVEQFDRRADLNIKRIQKRLRDGSFEFTPQIGVAKKKSSGNGKRGIVMASIENRIVERALLETLQAKSAFVKAVITYPTSVGGVPDRSVPHGLKIINEAIADGFQHFVRSDISGFFDNIPRKMVLERIAGHIIDEKFLTLLDKATTVILANEKALGEDRKIFPTDDDGVAQGSPLSPLFGNILLFDFDKQFNKDGVICVRFIDDFVLLSKDERRVTKAFQSAKAHLERLGLKCHDPFVNPNKEKAQRGKISEGFVFLGYDIRPGLMQPSAKARDVLLKSIRDRIKFGMRNIKSALREPGSDNTQRYVQTLVGIDRAMRGWGNAFAYGNSAATLDDLDLKIDGELVKFRSEYGQLLSGRDWKARRRTGGICLLSDLSTKNLADVPFKLAQGARFKRSAKTVTISTDGSVQGNKRNARDKGPGGWAYVVHDTDQEGSGLDDNVTNNQMELRAVIEALKAINPEKSICIRTDSKYVEQIANGTNLAKTNSEMWREFELLAKERRIKVEWVRGHAGDPHNERADALAKQRSLEAAQLRPLQSPRKGRT